MLGIAFLYIFGIGWKLAGPTCGVVALLVLFLHLSPLSVDVLRSNNTESATVLIYAAGVYHFFAWRSLNPDVKRHVYAMALWFVVGVMTTSVAVLFLPAVLGLAALVKREDRGRLYRDWPTFALAAVLAIVLIASWVVYQHQAHGREFVDLIQLRSWHFNFTQYWTGLQIQSAPLVPLLSTLLFLLQVWRRRWVEGLVIVLWLALPVGPAVPPLALVQSWLVATIISKLLRVFRMTSFLADGRE